MRIYFWVYWLFMTTSCVSPAASSSLKVRDDQLSEELWVDATPSTRKQSLEAALEIHSERPRRIHLREGVYRGPWQIEGPVTLLGHGKVVLVSERSAASVVSFRGVVSLEALAIQGAQTSLAGQGEIHLQNVSLGGFATTGISVEGKVFLKGSVVEGSVSGALGLVVKEGSEATVENVQFQGDLRRAIEVKNGTLWARRLKSRGPSTVIHQIGGQVMLEEAAFGEGRGPAVFSSKGAVSLKHCTVQGHEYALQTGPGANVNVVDFNSFHPERAAIALVKSEATLREVLSVEAGNFGALQLIESNVVAENVRIFRPQSYGAFARFGQLRLKNAVISDVLGEEENGVRTGGDGVRLYGGKHVLSSVHASSLQGAGVVASGEAEVSSADFSCEGCEWGGVVVEGQSKLHADAVRVQDSLVAVAVSEKSELSTGVLTSHQNKNGPLWVDCGLGGRVMVGVLESDAPTPKSSCVEVSAVREVQGK